MKEQVNRSDFSEAAYSYLYDNFISYGASSGFSADVMTAALPRDQITADMADSITRLYQGDTAIDTRNAILNTTYDNLINDLNPCGGGAELVFVPYIHPLSCWRPARGRTRIWHRRRNGSA